MAGYLALRISVENGVSIDTPNGTIRIKLSKVVSSGDVKIAIDAPRECLVLRDGLLPDYVPDWERAKKDHAQRRARRKRQKHPRGWEEWTPERRRHVGEKGRFR